MACIAENGFHALRVRQVAQRAGINHTTLLHHFPSKGALVQGVLETVEATLAPQRSQAPPVEPVQGLQAEYADAVDRLAARSDELAVVLELLLAGRQHSEIRALMARLYANWRAEVEDLIRRGQETGVFRRDVSPSDAADLITTQLTGLALTALGGAAGRASSELADMAYRAVVSWLLIPPEDRRTQS
jgi:AcrR family transcriptional regulator